MFIKHIIFLTLCIAAACLKSEQFACFARTFDTFVLPSSGFHRSGFLTNRETMVFFSYFVGVWTQTHVEKPLKILHDM